MAAGRPGLSRLLDEADRLVPQAHGTFSALREEMDRLERLGIYWQRPAVKVDGEILQDGLEPLLAMLREGQSSAELSRAGADLADLAGSLLLRARAALRQAGAEIALHAGAASGADLPLAVVPAPGVAALPAAPPPEAAEVARMDRGHEILVLKASPGAWPRAVPFSLPAGQVRHLVPGESAILHLVVPARDGMPAAGGKFLVEAGPHGTRIEGPAVLSASPLPRGVLGRLRHDHTRLASFQEERDHLRKSRKQSRSTAWKAVGVGIFAACTGHLLIPVVLPAAGLVLMTLGGLQIGLRNLPAQDRGLAVDTDLQARIDSGALADDIRSAGLAGNVAIIDGMPVLPRRVRVILDDIVSMRRFPPMGGRDVAR